MNMSFEKRCVLYILWETHCHAIYTFLAQIYAHYEGKKNSQHRRNLAITGGVALSIITAPVIAAVSVGKFTVNKEWDEKLKRQLSKCAIILTIVLTICLN